MLPLAVARDASVTLVNDAVRQQRTIGVLTQKEAAVDDPVEADLFSVGTLTHIHKMFKFPDGTLRLVVQGVGRFKVLEITQYRPYIKARIEVLKDIDSARQGDRGEGPGPGRALHVPERGRPLPEPARRAEEHGGSDQQPEPSRSPTS